MNPFSGGHYLTVTVWIFHGSDNSAFGYRSNSGVRRPLFHGSLADLETSHSECRTDFELISNTAYCYPALCLTSYGELVVLCVVHSRWRWHVLQMWWVICWAPARGHLTAHRRTLFYLRGTLIQACSSFKVSLKSNKHCLFRLVI